MAANVQQMVSRVPLWHHKFEIAPGVWTPGSYQPSGLWKRLQMPDDLSGLRALDIGARDGFYTLQLLMRGAEVTAVDYMAASDMGFTTTMQVSGFEPTFIQANVYDLPQLDLGSFDIVLYLGVLYHVPDPYLSMEIMAQMTRNGGICYIESTNLDAGVDGRGEELPIPDALKTTPLAAFVRRNQTSYWDLNEACIRQMAEDVGFAVRRTDTWGKRVLIEAMRTVDPKNEAKKSLSRGTVTHRRAA